MDSLSRINTGSGILFCSEEKINQIKRKPHVNGRPQNYFSQRALAFHDKHFWHYVGCSPDKKYIEKPTKILYLPDCIDISLFV